MEPIWHIRLLGGLTLRRGACEISHFRSRRTAYLLAYMAFHLRQSHSRDSLVEHVWPDKDTYLGRHSLSQALHLIRKALEPEGVPPGSVLRATQYEVRLDPRAVTTDVSQFARLVQEGETARDRRERLARLTHAVELYRGEFLPACYDDWAVVERERLAVVFSRVLRSVLKELEAMGDKPRALDYALRAVRSAPFRKEVYHDTIRLSLALGRTEEARTHYEMLLRVLEAQGEGAPDAAIRRLMEERAPGSTRREPRPEIQPPEGLFASRRAAPLPPILTRFFGREEELASLVQLLDPGSEGPHLLLTLTGAGGAGKTRLALEAAKALRGPYGGRVHFIPLADVSQDSRLVQALLDGAGVSASPQQDPLSELVRALGPDPAVLILDNAEHVVEACARAVEVLLRRAPGLRFLVTSRVPLEMTGEKVLPLSPLPVPDRPGTPDRLMEFAAVQMFVDRAQNVRPDFCVTPRNAPAIAGVCQQLEGIPLAIELAAARAHTLTPGQMLAELDDRLRFLVGRSRNADRRHHTLRNAIEWSYALLEPRLQRFFCLLSIFRGGWSLEAARAVASETDALDDLQQLVSCSMVTAEEVEDRMRYRMLESLREFGAQELDPKQAAAARRRHADYFVRFAEEMEPLLRGPQSQRAAALLDLDHENLRLVLERSRGREQGFRIAAAVWRFWSLRGYVEEGRTWLEECLASAAPVSPQLRVRALNGLASLAQEQSDYATVERRLAESAALADESGDLAGRAEMLLIRAAAEQEQGLCAPARLHAEASLRLYQELKDPWGIAACLNSLGQIAHHLGALKEACERFQQSLEIYEDLGDWARAAVVHNNRGAAALEKGDLIEAEVSCQHSLALARASGNLGMIPSLQYNLGQLLFEQGRFEAAATHILESIRLFMECGNGEAILLPLMTLGNIAAKSGKHTRAATLFGTAARLEESSRRSLTEEDRNRLSQDLAAVRAALAPADFESAFRYGWSLSLERAAAFALGQTESGPRQVHVLEGTRLYGSG